MPALFALLGLLQAGVNLPAEFRGTERSLRITAPRIESSVTVDGVLEEQGWSQAARLTEFLDRYTPAMDSLMSEIRPRLDTVRAAMRTEITRFLDPKQQKEYEAMQQKRDQERKAGGPNAR